jgi:hypothetical protein
LANLTSQKRYDVPELVEVRLNSLQLLYIDEALGRVDVSGLLRESWYRLGLEHQRARAEGKSVILTFPARLGALPADCYGIKPDCRGEWLPVIIRALQKSDNIGLIQSFSSICKFQNIWLLRKKLK